MEKKLHEPIKYTVHDLKCWPRYFQDIMTGRKNFEVRKNDRGFQEGHWLRLYEWNPSTEKYTGRMISAEIQYILKGGNFGLQAGYVVMGLYFPKFQPFFEEIKR